MKKKQVQLSLFVVLLFLFGFETLCLGQPKATIVSTNTSICESGVIDLKIKFEGTAPFGVVYTIYNNETESSITFTRLKQSDAIRSEDLDANGIWTVNQSFGFTSTITINKVFDATIPPINTPEGPAWDINDGSEEVFGEMIITVDRTPAPEAGNNVTGCGYSYALKAIPQERTNETFWDDVANGTFNDKTSPNAVFTADVAGSFTLSFNEKSGTCIGKDQVTVNLQGFPKSTISGETTICSTDGNAHTLNATVTLQGSAPFRYKISDGADFNAIKYDQPAGPTSIDLYPSGATTYSIIELKDVNDCFATVDDMTGTGIVNDNKPNTFAGDDAISCTTSYTLNAAPDPNATGVWTTVGSGVTIDNANSASSDVSVADYGVYNLLWTETYAGCDATDEVTIRFDEPPTLTLLQPDTAICESSQANMRLLTVSESSSYPLSLDYSIEGSNSTETITTPAVSFGLSPIVNSVYQLDKITNSYGCYTDLTDQFSVDVHSVPEADPGDYPPECGNSITLDAQLTDGNYGFWNSKNNSFFDDVQLPNTTFTVPLGEQKINGDFQLTWTEINGQNKNCINQEEVTITFDKKPKEVYAGKDTILYHEAKTLQLDASIHESGMNTYWTDPSSVVNFDSPYHPKTLAKNIVLGDNILIWTVENESCLPQSDTIIVKLRTFDAPNGFSPNNDGKNDVFRIGGAEQILNHKFMVFDINGKLVYSKPLTSEGWRGVDDNNRELPNGTYYYIFSGGNFEEKDYLILKSSTRP